MTFRSLLLTLVAAGLACADEPVRTAPGTLRLRPRSTNLFEALSLSRTPRTPSTNASAGSTSVITPAPVATPNANAAVVPAAGYLDAWRAAHGRAEPDADAREVDEYLGSTPDPRALRSHLQVFIRRRPGAWLASPFPRYPSPTGDRAGAWKKIFPDLVSREKDVLQRQEAFDALLQLFEGTPDQKVFHQQLARHALPGMLLRACRNTGLSAAIRTSLTPLTVARLDEVERAAAGRGLWATAAVVALHAHQLEHQGLPENRTLSEALRRPADSAPQAIRAQYYAAHLVAALWPPLSVSGVESPRMHDLLSRLPVFTELRLQKVLGIVPGTLEQQTAAVLGQMEPGSPELALGGQPPRLMLAGLGDRATWGEVDGPELRQQMERLRAARKAEAEGIKAAGWSRRFHNPEAYERQLAELRGESVRHFAGPSAAEVQNQLAAAERYRGEFIRDGVAIGRDPNRFDRIYTREANSFERRELDFRVDVERRRLEEARLNDQRNAQLENEYRAREREIQSQLSDAYRSIRESEKEWAPKLRDLRSRVEQEEARLRHVRGEGVPVAELEARHDAIRISELTRHRTQRIEALRRWEPAGADVTSLEAEAERSWRRWLTVGDEPEYVPPVIGGLPLP